MNKIISFKNRKVDYKGKVQIYRTLTKGPGVYSIKQKGLVVGHTTCLTLTDCRFNINLKGQLRVRKEGRKNVHAWITGIISENGAMGSCAEDGSLPAEVTYNPYKDDFFKVTNLTTSPYKISEALAVFINISGVSAAYTNLRRNNAHNKN